VKKQTIERVRFYGSLTGAIIGTIVVLTYFAEASAPWVVHPVQIEAHMQQLARHDKQLEQITDIAEQDRWWKDFQVCQALGGKPEICKAEADEKAEGRRVERDRGP